MVKVEKLPREFVDGKTKKTLSEVDESYTPEQVRDFYANQFPHLTNARVEGPEILKFKVKYTFVTTVGTKG